MEARDHLLRGQRLLQEGRPAEAIEPLLSAAHAFQTNAPVAAQAWNYLGLAYHRAGRPVEAAQAYKAALDRDLNLFDARYNLGALFFEQGNFTAAINELTSYTAHQPRDPAGWILLGRAQLRAGLPDVADRNLLQALRLNPTPLQQAAALNALGLGQVQRRRAREAFQYFEAALNRVTNYPPALLNQAVLSQQLQDRNFALQKYAAYLAVAGHAPDADAIRSLTNRLTEQIALTLKPAPPAGAVDEPSLGANGRTSAPPTAPTVEAATASLRSAASPSQPAAALPPAVSSPPAAASITPRTVPETAAALSPPPATTETTPSNPAPAVIATSPPPRTGPAQTQIAPVPTVTVPETVAKVPTETTPAVKSPLLKETAAATPSAAPAVPAAVQSPPATPALETVEVAAEPELKPAVDVAPATPPAFQPATPSARETIPAAKPAPTTAAVASPPEQAASVEPESPRQRSLFARLNPLNLIRGEDSPEKVREREAKKAAEQARRAEREARKEAARKQTTPVERKPAPAAAPAQPTEPPRPAFARYAYTRPAVPSPGNRAEAERGVAEGLAAHRAGRLAEALAAYARAAQADPAHFAARFNLAVAAFESGDWPRALTAYETALALAPDDANARYGFALALERAGYPLEAAAELERLLARDPRHVEGHLALANLCATTLDDRPRAREHYLKVLQLQPNHPQAGQIKRWLGLGHRP